MRVGWLVLLTLGCLVAACSSPSPSNQPVRTPGVADATRGREIFLQRGCGSCHALQAAGSNTTVGPSLNGIGRVAAERKPGMSAEAYIRESIENPNAFVVQNYTPLMPPQLVPNVQEMNDLVAFLLAQ